MAEIRITLKRSVIGATKRQKETAKALGLTKTGKTVTHEDTPEIRGMIRKINHLVEVQEV